MTRAWRLAWLGTAALVATSAGSLAESAQGSAEDLAFLKSEIEALNTRLAQLEAAPAVPDGYQLLVISEGVATSDPEEKRSDYVGQQKATFIGILPTADIPAATTIEWHGQVRAALTYSDREDWSTAGGFVTLGSSGDFNSINDSDQLDENVRGRVSVRAETQTAVGEVGVSVRLESKTGLADNSESLGMDIAWGWWQMTPELQLAGGYAGSLASVPHGMDWQMTHGETGGLTNYDSDQLRLTYKSGPMSFAVAVEDSQRALIIAPSIFGIGTFSSNVWAIFGTSYVTGGSDKGDVPALSARFTYAGDQLYADVSAIWQDDDFTLTSGPSSTVVGGDDDWFVGAGATYLGDNFLISIAAGIGEGYEGAYNGAEFVGGDDGYWGASIAGRLNLTDSTYVELGYGYSELDWMETFKSVAGGGEVQTHAVNTGIYYAPVKELTIGLQADYQLADYEFTLAPGLSANPSTSWETEAYSVSFVSWYSF